MSISREDVARYAAPAAFLLAVTVVILLVHSGLGGRKTSSQATVPVSTAAATTSASTTTPAASTAVTPVKQFYVIRAGDTFGVVALKFNTTVEALQALNPDASTTSLTIGQRIRVK